MATVQVTRRLALTGTAAAMTGAIAPHASAATETIWSGEYWAVKRRNGAHIRLAVYRKRIGAPQSGETPRSVFRSGQHRRTPAPHPPARGIATMEDLWDFYRQLPSGDKQFSVIAGAAHALATCRNRQAFWHVTQAFLTMPVPPGT